MFQQLDFSHERNLTIDELIKRVESYYPDADFALLRKAYLFAERSHKGQMRSSGEEYIIHPMNVAATLIKLRMDIDSICAGFLHDVVEDCDVTPEEIEQEFGTAIAQIVVGLTKISKIKFKTKEESQAENFRKMVVAMAKDLRVIIVKLSDRMHNMRTLQYVNDDKQKKIAQETLDIYVPLASRLGINSVKTELEDLCLRFLHPDIYYRLAEKIAMKKSEREDYIKETLENVEEKLLEYSLKAFVKGRSKHFFSIYKKMKARGVDFEQIHDILAFRVIVNNITECYKTLGIIHSHFTPIPGRFKDYIAIPKVNNYQSLHTTVIGPKAERIEIQIRTHDMDEVAERGVAAHWKYKEGMVSGTRKLDWVEELLEFNQNVENNSEFMDVVKNDLDIGGVFVFTPTGDVRELRYGATPLDFAYSIHTDVGNKCVGAKVNGKMVPLRYTLKSGDTVEVLTSKTQTPSKDWMNIVKSSKAKAKIRQWLLKTERDRNRELGHQMLDKALKLFSVNIKHLLKSHEMKQVLKEFKCKDENELFQFIGAGKYTPKQVIEKVPSIEVEDKEEATTKIEEIDTLSKKLSKSARRKSNKDNAVIVDGMEDVLVRMARCCNPIPGDPIVGYITRGRGITVHKADCNRMEGELSRRIHIEWNPDFSFKHPVNIRIITHDKPGILSQISKQINNIGVNIRSALAKSLHDRKGSFIFEIEVKDYSELLKAISSIEALEEVISVTRA
ncbi:bifunctional (p)ppGpp synthetase/guanosine-3',5'-bis(diphosphate) 3'-pyrophosphohydrolase [Halobacteriovorax sp. GB3]|uniref:RelA/SpoT family protein n=1 Tax=Halobacteriovorax sp. GB3 TaxID=2719615 RepID=UPI0023611E26|nr:bifunctional (p)ppGpp synthetase/guanosine-3',5'-bis(diphosphate) 3'-pyrophosphohydrolase [Halobacteriovorax sp. GB3]MDD0854854.1 bifunctional (p)ppGpp synthetase/guanosine-3',5'-bis(diphosphate) 3'-pyrophosphohydrolase [Halobacteriovorax sp. GB3]